MVLEVDYKELEQELFELNPWEVENRRYYRWKHGLEDYPDEMVQHIVQDVEPRYLSLYQSAGGTTRLLTETHFLKNCTIRIHKHGRYMPNDLHQHNFFEIPYVYSGRCIQNCEGIEYEMQAGDLVIMPPFAKHGLTAFEDDAIVINILFRKSIFDSFLSSLLTEENLLSAFFCHAVYGESFDHQILIKTGNDPVLRELILAMWQERLNTQSLHDALLSSYFNAFLIRIVRTHLQNVLTLSQDVPPQGQITDILVYLQTHFKSTSLKEIAQKFNYSDNYISRLIKQYTGKSFTKTLQELRLNHAVQLLSTTSLPMEQVSEQSGFFDLSHFYRCFKERYQVTPVQYRQQSHE
ncbi:MAG: AraC family transcriptional regulator [Clostridiales bacterium]|nr:AraC family transcriptional regulator [Clostridiales bacterium]